MSADDNTPEQAREVEVVDVVPLAVIAEAAAQLWDGHTWRPEPTVLARADSDVATFAWPVLADLYERLDPPTVVRLVDEVITLRAAVGRHAAERQEAAREALIEAAGDIAERIAAVVDPDSWRRDGFDEGWAHAGEKIDGLLRARADGVTGRSE